MGKWIAEHAEYGQWIVKKDDMVIAFWADATEATPFTEPQATRYALALNIVDAGVDLGEAVRMLLIADELREFVAARGADEACDDALLDWLRSSANAVEGDKTKEDV